MPKPCLYIFRGLPGSGKSTLARQVIREFESRDEQCIRLNKDDIRSMMGYSTWNAQIESIVHKAIVVMTHQALRVGISVVNDNTNLTSRDLELAQGIAKHHEANFIVDTRCLAVPINECITRDLLRTGTARVGKEVIERMIKKSPDLFIHQL